MLSVWFQRETKLFKSPSKTKLAELTGPVAAKKAQYYDASGWNKLDAPGGTRRWTDDYASVLPHLSLWKVLD